MAVVALLAVVGASGCASLLPTLNVGGAVSAVMPEEDALSVPFMVDGFVKVEVWMLQVEGSVGWKQYTYYEDEGAVEIDETFNQMPVAATARFVLGPGLIRFLFGGGLVWNINDIEQIGDIDVEDPVSYRLLIGTDLKLVSSFRLGLEVSYDLSSDYDPFGSSNELDADGLMGRVTIGYHF
jgi:hypothetical protein